MNLWECKPLSQAPRSLEFHLPGHTVLHGISQYRSIYLSPYRLRSPYYSVLGEGLGMGTPEGSLSVKVHKILRWI